MSSYLPRTITSATLYTIVEKLVGNTVRHVLTTEDDLGVTKTIQTTYKDARSTDKEIMEAGVSFARQHVPENIPLAYSNNLGIIVEGKNLKRVAETLNESFIAHENSDPFNRLLLG